MTDERDTNLTEAQQWAAIFNILGKHSVRDVLFDTAIALDQEDADRKVVEFQATQAVDITQHVGVLEDHATNTRGDFKDGVVPDDHDTPPEVQRVFERGGEGVEDPNHE